MQKANYKITFWNEVKNNLLHILVGIVITHFILAYLPLWSIILILGVIGGGREYWQHRRGKIQPLYIHIIDTCTCILGGVVWYWFITTFNISIDLL